MEGSEVSEAPVVLALSAIAQTRMTEKKQIVGIYDIVSCSIMSFS